MPVKKSASPSRASAEPTRFLVLYRNTVVRRGTWMLLPESLVVATDLLEHRAQRCRAGVEDLAAGEIGELLELVGPGLAKEHGEGLDPLDVLWQAAEIGQ